MLRATRKSLFVRKTFTLAQPKVDVSFNLHTTAGVSYKGKPCASFPFLTAAVDITQSV